MKRFLVLFCVLWVSAVSPAAAEGIDDLAWMAGDWQSEEGGGLVQEVWTGPRAGSMTGMFRLINAGKVTVLEYVVIAQETDGITYQFKHFMPDYSTWEGDGPHLRFALAEQAPGRAVFKNIRVVKGQPAYISYIMGEDGRLSIHVGGPPDAEPYEGFVFTLTRQ